MNQNGDQGGWYQLLPSWLFQLFKHCQRVEAEVSLVGQTSPPSFKLSGELRLTSYLCIQIRIVNVGLRNLREFDHGVVCPKMSCLDINLHAQALFTSLRKRCIQLNSNA